MIILYPIECGDGLSAPADFSQAPCSRASVRILQGATAHFPGQYVFNSCAAFPTICPRLEDTSLV